MSLAKQFRRTETAGVPEESNQGDKRPAGRVTFPRGARLLRHADFERVYKQGRRHFSASMTVFYLERLGTSTNDPASPGLRIGFTVGRALGGAVQRNRMKRRLREAVRLTRPFPGASADVVINPKKMLLTNDFDAVLNEVRQAFVVIDKKLRGKNELRRDSAVIDQVRSGSRKPESGSQQ